MDIYAILKFLHVLLAIAAVGANMTYGIWLSRAARDPKHLAFTLKGVKVLDDRIANPAYALLLVTGIGMLLMKKVAPTTPWLLLSLILYAVLVVVGMLGYTPTLRRQIAVLGTKGPHSPEYRLLAARGMRLGVLLAIVVIIIAFLMVTKPALWG